MLKAAQQFTKRVNFLNDAVEILIKTTTNLNDFSTFCLARILRIDCG